MSQDDFDLEIDENTLPEEYENIVSPDDSDVEVAENQSTEPDVDGNQEDA